MKLAVKASGQVSSVRRIEYGNTKTFSSVVNEKIRPCSLVVAKKVFTVNEFLSETTLKVFIHRFFSFMGACVDFMSAFRTMFSTSKIRLGFQPQLLAKSHKTAKPAFN